MDVAVPQVVQCRATMDGRRLFQSPAALPTARYLLVYHHVCRQTAEQMSRFMNDQPRLADVLALMRTLPPGPIIREALT